MSPFLGRGGIGAAPGVVTSSSVDGCSCDIVPWLEFQLKNGKNLHLEGIWRISLGGTGGGVSSEGDASAEIVLTGGEGVAGESVSNATVVILERGSGKAVEALRRDLAVSAPTVVERDRTGFDIDRGISSMEFGRFRTGYAGACGNREKGIEALTTLGIPVLSSLGGGGGGGGGGCADSVETEAFELCELLRVRIRNALAKKLPTRVRDLVTDCSVASSSSGSGSTVDLYMILSHLLKLS